MGFVLFSHKKKKYISAVWIQPYLPENWNRDCFSLASMFPRCALQEFAGEDTSDLFLEEREASLRQAQEEKHKIQMSVPGILNPHEIPEEMCDWTSAPPVVVQYPNDKRTLVATKPKRGTWWSMVGGNPAHPLQSGLSLRMFVDQNNMPIPCK